MDKKTAGGNELLNPETILNQAGVGYGNIVGDLGCGGMGYFTLQAAKAVGDKGQVYAVDVVKTVLQSVETKAKLDGLTNIKTIWSDLEVPGATKINEASLDFALLINVLFQTQKHEEMIKESVRLLKRGGKLVVVDWKKNDTPFGPKTEARVLKEKVQEIAEKLGCVLERSLETGPYHYWLEFIKK
ncbi:class I SAM-dependent methyltransferase [Patescibacteria group bacterium]|nr:class I SAM-dependent methyltransferase [Patescibacteria group bacterium]MBU1074975.1 class I SAM-dependent methyltransferase [Patescibacteria group bacterium]MBU2229622.1 class I SAM-dependent methyltransferase [Patescibacteria group bacterium]MBU2235803.1 class I SAM-dependent methyltransferase [Patescibacteria group bacterium]